MNEEDLACLISKYLNGYKIVKVEKDPFIKGQINLWTDEWRTEAFYDRSLVKFFVREEPNTAKIYQELVNKENTNLKQALNEIREYFNKTMYFGENAQIITHDILQIIDKVLGDGR